MPLIEVSVASFLSFIVVTVLYREKKKKKEEKTKSMYLRGSSKYICRCCFRSKHCMYGSHDSSYRLQPDFNLICSLYWIGSPCKHIGHYHFFSEGNLTLTGDQMKTVPTFGAPAVPLRTAKDDDF